MRLEFSDIRDIPDVVPETIVFGIAVQIIGAIPETKWALNANRSGMACFAGLHSIRL